MKQIQEILTRIADLQKDRTERTLITIDGPCASGKTTLSSILSERTEAPVLHTDEFVVPHARKTPERLAIPGGNCDWERLTAEVLIPWKKGEKAWVRRYLCRRDCFAPAEPLGEVPLLILEGSYSNLPAIRELADLRIFVDTPEEVRMQRLRERESAEYFPMFEKRWIPLENAYFSAYHLPDEKCILVSGIQEAG